MLTCTNEASGRAAGPARSAILQIHPSLRCNLTCAHCYSNSGPAARAELDPSTVSQVIADAAAMGFRVVSLSGGEPFMYASLEQVLETAKSHGLRTTVTTNGYFHQTERLRRLRDLIDVLAVSIDGPPDIHNQVRQSRHAFERLETGIARFKDSGIPFGLIHTLTRHTWEHLLWVADYAATHSARLFQIHPLELTGRACAEMTDAIADDDVLARVYVLAFALATKYVDAMKVQVDLVYRDHLLEQPELVYADALVGSPAAERPVDSLGLLVLEPDGAIVPVAFGFSRRYQVCNVKSESLAEAWPTYLQNGYREFRSLCREVWQELSRPDAPILSNWHELIVSRSHTGSPAVIRAFGEAARR